MHRRLLIAIAGVGSLFLAGVPAHAQNCLSDLTERTVELLVLVNECTASPQQLTRLDVIRREILAGNLNCTVVEQQVSSLEGTLPFRGARRLVQSDMFLAPVPHCGQDQTRVFLADRLNQLVSEEPDRNRFIRRLTGAPWGQPTAATSEDGSTVSFSTSLNQLGGPETGSSDLRQQRSGNSGLDVWTEGHFTGFDEGNKFDARDGKFGLLYVGADALVSRDLLIGALVQFDWMSEGTTQQFTRAFQDYDATGNGWMAGPYLGARLAKNLFFDARAEWGQSSNRMKVSDLNRGIVSEVNGDFDTNRWLASGALTSTWHYEHWRFTPSVSATYAQERQDAYGIGSKTVDAQTVSLGRLAFGPEVAYRLNSGDTIFEPFCSIKGLWDFARPSDIPTPVFEGDVGPLRGRIEAGLLVSSASGVNLKVSGNYDGLGIGDFNSYGGEAWVNVPLH